MGMHVDGKIFMLKNGKKQMCSEIARIYVFGEISD